MKSPAFFRVSRERRASLGVQGLKLFLFVALFLPNQHAKTATLPHHFHGKAPSTDDGTLYFIQSRK